MESNKNIVKINNTLSIVNFIPLLILVAFVPLIVRGHLVNIEEPAIYFWPGGTNYLDFFSYNKAIMITLLVTIASIIFIYNLIRKKITYKLEKHYSILLLLYATMTILSTEIAIDPHTAIWGFPDMMQGLPVLLSYIIIVLIVSNQVDNEKQINGFLKAFIVLVVLEGIIGLSQYFGHDIFQMSFASKLLLPSSIKIEKALKFTFGAGTIYGTLFNTNFVGSYGVLVVPLMLGLLFSSKNKKEGVIYSIAYIFALYTLFGSNSRAGYLGGVIASIFVIIMLRKVIIKKPKKSLMFLTSFIALVIIFNLLSGGRFLNRIVSIATNIDSAKENNFIGKTFVEDVKIDENTIFIKTNLQNATIKYENGSPSFIDENGEKLSVTIDEDNFYHIENTVNDCISMGITQNKNEFYVKIGRNLLPLYIQDGMKVLGMADRLYSIDYPPKILMLDKIGSLASGRGYIWSRTIPMLKDTIIFGVGPDCYIMKFPQDDVIGKLNYLRSYDIAVDKPHNMYLQIGINTGVVSLIAFLGICLFYIFSSIKLLWNSNYEKFIAKINLAFLMSIVGYLVAALFNDQINSVAPLFYVILGLGIASNRIYKSIKKKEKENELENIIYVDMYGYKLFNRKNFL